MPIQVTEKQNISNKPNYLEAGLFGAAAGYSAKYLIPVLNSEKDSEYKAYLVNVSKKARTAKKRAVADIVKSKTNKPMFADEFVADYKGKKLTLNYIKGLKPEQREQYLSFISDVNSVAKNVRLNGYDTLKIMTQKIRPTGAFVLIGAAAALIFTFCKNVFSESKNG